MLRPMSRLLQGLRPPLRWSGAQAFALFAVVAAGCTPTVTLQDLSVLPPGCRNPSGCWSLSCACSHAKIGDCLLCDPTKSPTQTCQCGDFDGGVPNSVCEEPGQVCVGRAPVTCPGRGARCLHADELTAMGCAGSGGVPPDVVTMSEGDAGAALEQRCSFIDDVCCAGSDDGGEPFDAAVDQAVPDLGAADLATPDLRTTTD